MGVALLPPTCGSWLVPSLVYTHFSKDVAPVSCGDGRASTACLLWPKGGSSFENLSYYTVIYFVCICVYVEFGDMMSEHM